MALDDDLAELLRRRELTEDDARPEAVARRRERGGVTARGSDGARPRGARTSRAVTAGAVPAAALEGSFPPIDLPVRPPFPAMLAKSADALPTGPGWLYEPKWDGFRCLVFRRDVAALDQLRQLDLAAAFLHGRLERRAEHATGAAPLGPEVDDDRHLARALDDVLLEARLADVHGVHGSRL